MVAPHQQNAGSRLIPCHSKSGRKEAGDLRHVLPERERGQRAPAHPRVAEHKEGTRRMKKVRKPQALTPFFATPFFAAQYLLGLVRKAAGQGTQLFRCNRGRIENLDRKASGIRFLFGY